MISLIKIIFSTTANQDSDLITLFCINLLPLHINVLSFPFDAKFSLEVLRGVFLDLPKAFDNI